MQYHVTLFAQKVSLSLYCVASSVSHGVVYLMVFPYSLFTPDVPCVCSLYYLYYL